MGATQDTENSNNVVNSPENLTSALRVGHAAIAQKQGSDSRFRLELIGWNQNKFLVAGLPRNMLVSGHVAGGDTLVIRYILRGVVYAFACQVIHVIFDPPLALVGWPRDLSALPLTQEKRISVQIPATLETVENGQPSMTILATVTDLSKFGCQIEAVDSATADMPTEAGCKVRLLMNLGATGESETINAEIRNAMNAGGKLLLGIKFDADTPLDLSRITQHYLGVE